ncbi:hypothetical protein M409DRAFT_16730 [Zasmidium cellare ATCC 36951]|uniref:SUN domain-containing protein n=1 Tax=Zasmidium cellare ATCC 36951 TaxID=1080233 RepID=A0A6A6D0R2_ZASCE|nr:uncharacterized protein M409DRAFT_16730 [Zasmidium cellare ATCC 36951]KAF2172765.1 hypothetical protein M409DRAFT_16730 [Zasmidium cellare ATCC 36951]
MINKILRNVVVLAWIFDAVGTSAQDHGDTTPAAGSSSSTVQITSTTTTTVSVGTTGSLSRAGNSTCPSRTVNYITHTLPRQCLRTDRVPYNSTASINATGSAVTTSESDSLPLETSSLQAADNGTMPNATPNAEATPTPTDGTETSASNAASPSILAAEAQTLAEEDADSPLDNANFLSFEEWKRQNLAKTGQSPEDIGRSQAANPDRPRPVINNALDSLGEEAEIDLDFSGFGGAVNAPGVDSHTVASSASTYEHAPGNALSRSKDAGKTCKERTNYASFDCSATILKSNKECKSASSVLVENKDSYMLNVCSASNKFFVLELCTDIQIDTIVLANYEFFSSSFRHFRVSVSDRYPVKMEKWRDLGTFEARNTREIQAFLVENPLIWAKYLRIEFLTHYGTEYYCPVSLLRVHGTTMIEDFRHQAGYAAGDDEELTLEPEASATLSVVEEPVLVTEEAAETVSQAEPADDSATMESLTKGLPVETAASTANLSEHEESVLSNSSAVTVDNTGSMKAVGVYEPLNLNLTCNSLTTSSSSVEDPSSTVEQVDSTPPVTQTNATATATKAPEVTDSATTNSTSSAASTNVSPITDTASSPQTSQSVVSENSTSSITPITSTSIESTSNVSNIVPANATMSSTTSSQPVSSVNETSILSSSSVGSQPSQKSETANSTRAAPSSTSAQPAQPSTQESFFKSFHKRLLSLESNSTLSLQYIEEQSRILRDAFSKVEKRQVGSTTKFLSQLNETVMTELHGFRQAYDQLWQSTVIELEGQRETYQWEMLALSARLTMVADELVWQKRMGIVQSTLLLLCLALVLFGRSSNGYIEMPLMQQMMNRSTAALRAGWESPPNSPSPDSRSPVSLFRRKLWRSSTEPAGENGNLTDSEVSRPQSKEGPNVLVEPPSPMSQATQSDFDDEDFGDSSPNAERKENQNQGALSPKRKKKQKKPPPGWASKESGLNERVKSPLAM